MTFREGPIEGVVWLALERHHDGRGWLCELFRRDELEDACWPAMAYASVTEPGVARGPHEHAGQSDLFCFLGPSAFRVYLWDNRPGSPTFGHFQTEVAGAHRPARLLVPPGVVHAYRNVGAVPGLVLNAPNRLYAGEGRRGPVDEVRHEDRPGSPFALIETGVAAPAGKRRCL
jgi:dTDP-4-dehydrorhamnose 3,5-epimerase